MKKATQQQTLHWGLAIIWMVGIYFLSAQPSLHSGLPSRVDLVLRKLAHITEYAVLTFLLARAAYTLHVWKYICIEIAVVGALIYAMLDEYHQTFVFGRSGSWADVGIDAIGIALTLVLIKKFWK